MSYIDGFVIAVPIANKDSFITFSQLADQLFIDHGALRVWECWGDDVPRGQVTDFFRAVQASEDETVAFSWIEWPDKAHRDAAMPRIDAAMKTDPRFDAMRDEMPFDGKRMIFGGFEPVVVLGE